MVGDRVKVRIASETGYPFTETITMKVAPERPVEFPLSLRVPGWCAAPEIRVNGTPITLAPVQGFQRIQRTWQAGDQVTLYLPMRAAVATDLDRNPKGPSAPFAGHRIYQNRKPSHNADFAPAIVAAIPRGCGAPARSPASGIARSPAHRKNHPIGGGTNPG